MESRSLIAYLTEDELLRFKELIRSHEGLKYVIGEGRPDNYAGASAPAAVEAAAPAAVGAVASAEAAGRGLVNYRVTCWMNAFLQLLSNTPTLKSAVEEAVKSATRTRADDGVVGIMRGIKEVLDQLSSPDDSRPVSPEEIPGIKNFVELVDRADPSPSTTGYRDFSEAFHVLARESESFKGILVRIYTLFYCKRGSLHLNVKQEDEVALKILFNPSGDSPMTVQDLLNSRVVGAPPEYAFERVGCPDEIGRKYETYSLPGSKFLWLWFLPEIEHVFDQIRRENPDASESDLSELSRIRENQQLAASQVEHASKNTRIRAQTRITIPATNYNKSLIPGDWKYSDGSNYDRTGQMSVDMMKEVVASLDEESRLTSRLEFRLKGFVRWTGGHYFYVKVGEDEERDNQMGVKLTIFDDGSVSSTWVPYDRDGCLDLDANLSKGVLHFFFEAVDQSQIRSRVAVVNVDGDNPKTPPALSEPPPLKSTKSPSAPDSSLLGRHLLQYRSPSPEPRTSPPAPTARNLPSLKPGEIRENSTENADPFDPPDLAGAPVAPTNSLNRSPSREEGECSSSDEGGKVSNANSPVRRAPTARNLRRLKPGKIRDESTENVDPFDPLDLAGAPVAPTNSLNPGPSREEGECSSSDEDGQVSIVNSSVRRPSRSPSRQSRYPDGYDPEGNDDPFFRPEWS